MAMSSHQPILHGGTDEEHCRYREAFVRASLCEFVSMEDTIKRDAPHKSPPMITDSRNPLVHMIRLLRNLEVHLHTSTLQSDNLDVQLADAQKQAVPGTGHTITRWVTDPLTYADLSRLRDIEKHYSRAALQRLVDWYNSAQVRWGLPDLIYRAVLKYAEEIVAKLNLRAISSQ